MTLAVPQALEAAYLAVIGQISFVFSKILFELFLIYVRGGGVQASPEAVFIVIIVVAVPFVLIVNILSGWLSTRATFAEFSEYPNSLFLLDMVMIVIFFVLNNVVTFSVLQTGTSDYLSDLLTSPNPPKNMVLDSEIAQIIPPFVYLCTGLICVLYIFWNYYHGKERSRIAAGFSPNPKMLAHNRFLIFSAAIHAILFGIALLVRQLVAEYVCLVFWIGIWIWLNGAWIVDSPLSALQSPRRARKSA